MDAGRKLRPWRSSGKPWFDLRRTVLLLNSAGRTRKPNGNGFNEISSRCMGSEPPISVQDLHQGLVHSAAALDQFRLPYALIGGMATSYRSQPRFTKDIDLLLNIPKVVLPSLLEELGRRGLTFDHQATSQAWTRQHMAVLSYRGIRIDWLKPVLPLYQHVIDRATIESWTNQPIKIATPEGLILLKLLAFRTQDQLDIENLVAANR